MLADHANCNFVFFSGTMESNHSMFGLCRFITYRVDSQESQLVVWASILGGYVLGLQVPAREGRGHVNDRLAFHKINYLNF